MPDLPYFVSDLEKLTVKESTKLSYTLPEYRDANNYTVSISVEMGKASFIGKFISSSKSFAFNPPVGFNGSYSITVTLTDTSNSSNSYSLIVEVL